MRWLIPGYRNKMRADRVGRRALLVLRALQARRDRLEGRARNAHQAALERRARRALRSQVAQEILTQDHH